MKNKDNIELVCALDENFVIPTTVMLKSVVTNLNKNKNLNIYLLEGGISDYFKNKILKSIKSDRVSIKFIQINNNIFEGFRIDAHFSKANYYRLLIPELLPKKIEKAIYLDSDLIVNHDINKLWEMDIKAYYALAVYSRFMSQGLQNYEKFGFKPEDKYFNSGVLVMNLKKWKEDKIVSKTLKFIKENNPRWVDQDALNAIFNLNWKEINPKWNVTAPLFLAFPELCDKKNEERYISSYNGYPIKDKKRIKEIISNPYIIHFITSVKPWIKGHNPPKRQLFYYYLDMTKWKGWRPTLLERVKYYFNSPITIPTLQKNPVINS
ncbi:MAG: glycosyltransferase family 8 protein [Nanoarchaeota archaeon]|nr:glycosyltransferase family 8 protein [Nanoarchaeota archaeon]